MADDGLIVAVVDDGWQKHDAPNAGGVWVDFCAKADGVGVTVFIHQKGDLAPSLRRAYIKIWIDDNRQNDIFGQSFFVGLIIFSRFDDAYRGVVYGGQGVGFKDGNNKFARLRCGGGGGCFWQILKN